MKIEELLAAIKYCDDLYYKKGQQIISDQFYFDLKSLLPDGLLLSSYRTLKSVFSLEDIYRELIEKFNLDSIIVEPKIDGINSTIEWKDGELISITTRGDGEIRDNLVSIKDRIELPQRIKSSLRIKGELYLKKKDFNKLKKDFSHSRGAVLSLLKSKEQVEEIKISFLCFDLLETNHFPILDSYRENMERLRNCFDFDVVPSLLVRRENLLKLEVERMIDGLSRFLDADLDGLVFKVDSLQKRSEIGNSSSYPRWSLALKLNDQNTTITKLLGVEHKISRTGRIIFVARIEPFTYGGRKYERISFLRVPSIIRREMILHIKIIAGLIPFITEVIQESGKEEIKLDLEHCPSCGSIIKKIGSFLYCENRKCLGRIIDSLIYFCSKQNMNVKFLGEALIEKLVLAGILNNFQDVYEILFSDKKFEEVSNLIGRKIAEKIRIAIETSRSYNASRLLAALGLPGIGPVLVRTMISRGVLNLLQIIGIFKSGEEERLLGAGIERKKLSSLRGILEFEDLINYCYEKKININF